MDFRTPDSRGRYYDPRPTRPAHRPEPTPEPDSEPTKEQEPPARPKKRVRRAGEPKNWKRILVTVVLIGVIAWLAYGYITTKNQLEQQKNNPSAGAANSSQALIDKIAKVTVLPTNEAPTIATINNVSTLRSQSAFNKFFFANAKDGDKLLVYQKNNLAIIYRTATNQVVSSGPYDYSKVIQNPKQ